MKTPQVTIIIITLISLFANAYLHGKLRTGKYNFFTALTGALSYLTLLWMGGFFDDK